MNAPPLADPQLRLLDANANRAREGLRVLEDHARFVLDRAELAAEVRAIRHGVTEALAEAGVSAEMMLFARDVPGDVGARPEGPEHRGANPSEVLGAACGRVTEALRVLEETAAAASLPAASAAMATLRYRAYDLERRVRLSTRRPCLLTATPRIYFLWDLDACPREPIGVLEAALAGGVEWVQLRAKRTPARRVLELGRLARMRTLARGATLIVNDRADLAQLVGADGVHVGPDDLTASTVRRLLGAKAIVGGTTHSLADIHKAFVEPLDYVGFGPIGATRTKEGAGAPLGVAAYADLPEAQKLRVIPIGGIDGELAVKLVAAGARTICIGSAIFAAPDAERAAKEILQAMQPH